MKFSYLVVETSNKGEDKYILKDSKFRVYLPHSKYECKHSALTPHLGKELLVFVIRNFHNRLKFGTVIATVGGMTILDWIDEIPRMEVSGIVNNDHIVRFLDAVETQYRPGIENIEITMTNLQRAKERLESLPQSTEEMEWLLNVLPVLQFLYNRYGYGN